LEIQQLFAYLGNQATTAAAGSSSNPRGISLLSNPARAVSSTSMQAGTKGQQQQQQKAGNAT